MKGIAIEKEIDGLSSDKKERESEFWRKAIHKLLLVRREIHKFKSSN